MGYTHYWTFKKPTKGNAAKVEANYQRAIKQCNKIIQYYSQNYGGLSGYSAHTNKYGGLTFNGSRENAYETFMVREHYMQNFKDDSHFSNKGFNFCKTAQMPYDTVVVACLIVLKHYLRENIAVNSDGQKPDWIDGYNLAKQVLGLKTIQIPVSIRGSSLKLLA